MQPDKEANVKKESSRSQLMKRSSRSLVMCCVSRASRISRTQIVKETGLSLAHVCGVVDELIAKGELIETGSVSAGRGRPAILLEVNRNSISVGGVWLAEDSIEVGIAGATGEILARESLSYSGNSSDDIDAIVEAVKACAEQSGKSRETLRGIGVVVAGLVDPGLGLISRARPHSGFAGVPIAKLLQERVGIPVYADTDIRAAAVADQWRNGKSERALYVSFCGGVGAAFVIAGEVFGNAHGAAPLLGYAPIGPSGFLHNHTSIFAFVESLWPDVDARKLDRRQLQDMVGRGVDLVAQGDYDAIAAISQIAEYMGLGIANGINMLDPQKVYVVGTLIDCVPDMMVSIIRRAAIPTLYTPFFEVDIQPLMRLQEFEFKGAFGLVLFNGFRSLNRDISAKLMTPWSSEDGVVAVNRIGSGV